MDRYGKKAGKGPLIQKELSARAQMKGHQPIILKKAKSGDIMWKNWNEEDATGTLTTRNAGGSQRMPDTGQFNCVIGCDTDRKNIVRRLTPTECARLQGFPDRWGWPDILDDMDGETFEFWKEVRQTFDIVNGRQKKDYTKKQILTWYNKLHTDSAEYKMWGNGIALPTALYVLQGIADELEKSTDCNVGKKGYSIAKGTASETDVVKTLDTKGGSTICNQGGTIIVCDISGE